MTLRIYLTGDEASRKRRKDGPVEMQKQSTKKSEKNEAGKRKLDHRPMSRN